MQSDEPLPGTRPSPIQTRATLDPRAQSRSGWERLFYVTDPMCSWCWGFHSVWEATLPLLAPEVCVQWVMGGLARDSDVPMDEATRQYIQSAWREVAHKTGAILNTAFWKHHEPSRSTWPACRAVLAAGQRGPELFYAIQRAYYLEARDPSQRSVLLELAREIGLQDPDFAAAIDRPETRAQLHADFELRDQLNLHGMPAVAYGRPEDFEIVTRGWCSQADFQATLRSLGLLKRTA